MELESKKSVVTQSEGQFLSLKPIVAQVFGELAQQIVQVINGAIKLLVEDRRDYQRKIVPIRQAIEIARRIWDLVPKDPNLVRINADLGEIMEFLRRAETTKELREEDWQQLSVLNQKLENHSAKLSEMIERGLATIIDRTPQGVSVLKELKVLTDWYYYGVWENIKRSYRGIDRPNLRPPSQLAPVMSRPSNPSGSPGNQGQRSTLADLDSALASLSSATGAVNDLRTDVAQLPAQIAALQAQVAQLGQQSTIPFNRLVASFLPATRTGSDFYPVALTDYPNVFLEGNLEGMARITYDALTTRTPRFSDIHSFLRRELESAYDLLPYFEPSIQPIHEHVVDRDFQALENDYTRLAMALPGELRGKTRDILAILSWAIAVDAGLLNQYTCYHVKNLKDRGSFECPDPESLVFYWHEYLPGAEEPRIFQELVRKYWPILTFAVDPAVDEQNIDEASSTQRELQLALAFAFAAGRVSFNQLDRFTRRIEYDAETIALNRTVSAFTQGRATFGWRFYPRFQPPPSESTNFHVIANLLIKGGQGRNYQMDNSKLEPGQRELQAVVVMPSFVRSVTFHSTGNWFLLHDPEQLIVPTARMLRQSQKVTVLKQDLQATHDCGHFRQDDLDQLQTHLEQVEEILPMQSRQVNVPFSEVSGFELFTPISGSQALVPQLLGYDGADYIDPNKETDIVLYGKRFSILETQVIAGGKYLVRTPSNPEQSNMDIISRDVMRVILPPGLQPTLYKEGKPYVEVVVSTPNGVSNRFPIPFGPASSPQSTPEPLNVETGYTLMDDLLKMGADVTPANPQQGSGTPAGQAATTIQTTQTIQVTQGGQAGQGSGQGNQPGGGGAQGGQGGQGNPPKLTAKPTKVAKGTRIRIMSKNPPTKPSATVKADFRFPVASSPETVISVIVNGIPYKDNAYIIDESLLNTVFTPDLIAKLDDFGKLTGQNPLHDLTTKTILITADSSDSSPKGTTNQLRVNIELYLQKKSTPPQSQTTGGTPTLSATATDGTGHSATATVTGGTPSATTTPTSPGATTTGGASSSPASGGTIPTPGHAPAPAGGTSGVGGASTSGVSSSIRLGTTLPPPGELPVSIRQDPVVTRAAQAPAIARPAPAQPLPGIGARTTASRPSAPGFAPRGASGGVPPARPRGRAQPRPVRSNAIPPSARSAPRPSSSSRDEPLPPLPGDRRPARRSLISRIMGKD